MTPSARVPILVLLARAGPVAAAQAPGEIGRSRSHLPDTGGMTMSHRYDGGALPAPGEGLYRRAAHVHRFEGARHALPLYREAAAAGSPQALRDLGFLYFRGDGVARDEPRGLALIDEAARRGDPVAMLALAGAFRRGEGVDRDDALARFWLVRSAEAGYRPAMQVRRRLATR